jgi:pimeloyl-ACP methyl ester carboxylesterase
VTAGVVNEPLRSADAAAIDVPVFIGAGDRDVVSDPHAEPSAYPRSTDFQIFVLKGSGHMHNFAGSRAQLWYRLHAWGNTVAASNRR